MRWMKNAVVCSLVAVLAGCGGEAEGGGRQAAGAMTGRAADTRGQPLAGVKVWADNTLLYNSNAGAVTGTDGSYRIDVSKPAGTWHASASLQRKYDGRSYTFDLDPSDDSVFPGNEGAVRNFTWRLSGARPEGGTYGAFVVVYASQLLDPASPGEAVRTEDIELTLVPDGKLVDGSDGAPLTKKLERTGNGDAVEDVPFGRYRFGARYVQAGRAPRAMQVRVRDTGTYADVVTATFETLVGSAHRLELEVRLPEEA